MYSYWRLSTFFHFFYFLLFFCIELLIRILRACEDHFSQSNLQRRRISPSGSNNGPGKIRLGRGLRLFVNFSWILSIFSKFILIRTPFDQKPPWRMSLRFYCVARELQRMKWHGVMAVPSFFNFKKYDIASAANNIFHLFTLFSFFFFNSFCESCRESHCAATPYLASLIWLCFRKFKQFEVLHGWKNMYSY